MKDIINKLIAQRESLSKSLIESKNDAKMIEAILNNIISLDGVLMEIFKYYNPEQ